ACRDEVRRRDDQPRDRARHWAQREQRRDTAAPRGRDPARALVRRGTMTGERMSTDGMSEDTWLHALRGEPSPPFKAQLRARLRAQEPEAETRRDWPRRAMTAAAAVVVVAALISVPGVRASVAQLVSLFRVINVV